MPEDGKVISLKPAKPIWWRVILGSFIILNAINNQINPSPTLLKADNSGEQFGMIVARVVLVALAIWLVFSGVRPLWRKSSN